MRNYAKHCIKSSSNICCDSNKYPKHMFYEEIRIKQGLFLPVILSIKDSLQRQINYNGNVFGNKCCRCNEGSLYFGGTLFPFKANFFSEGSQH